MKKIFFVGVLLAAFCAAGITIVAAMRGEGFRPSETMATRNITLADFHEIDASVGTIEYTPGAEGQAVLVAPDNVIGSVLVTVRDGKLSVELADDLRRGVRIAENLNIKLTVASRSLDDVSLSTGAKLTVNGDLSLADDFEIDCTTGATAVLKNVDCADADISAETGSAVEINALSAVKADIEAQTAANIRVAELTANKVDCEAVTSGVITVQKATAPYAELVATTAANISVGGDIVDGEATASTAGTITCPSTLRRTANTAGTVRGE